MQLGDYAGSLLYRLGKRGHRFKCWECGVKKKAPCGDTHRPDLPWCCHRRLGAHIACLAAAFSDDSVTLQGEFVAGVVAGSRMGGNVTQANIARQQPYKENRTAFVL